MKKQKVESPFHLFIHETVNRYEVALNKDRLFSK